MGTSKGWETRKRRQAEYAKEWDDSVFAAAVAEERKRLRPLLERAEAYLLALERYQPAVDGSERNSLLADLRTELGKEG